MITFEWNSIDFEMQNSSAKKNMCILAIDREMFSGYFSNTINCSTIYEKTTTTIYYMFNWRRILISNQENLS